MTECDTLGTLGGGLNITDSRMTRPRMTQLDQISQKNDSPSGLLPEPTREATWSEIQESERAPPDSPSAMMEVEVINVERCWRLGAERY
jgi:hypothetical protein